MTEPTTPIELTLDNFQQVLVEGSQQQPVMVAFWAPSDPVSQQLMPLLETLASARQGQFVLARVNVEADQMLAMQFGVQAVPTVALFVAGRQVDGFAGPKSAEELEQWLAPHLPKPEDDLRRQASEQLAQGDVNTAYTLATQALALDENNPDSKKLVAQCAIELGKLEQAEQLLASLGMADQDGDYQALKARLELAREAQQSPEVVALEQQLAAEPDNTELKLQLALQYSQHNRMEEGLALCFSVLQAEPGNNEAKKQLLDMINALPDGDPLASAYRRKLFSLLY